VIGLCGVKFVVKMKFIFFLQKQCCSCSVSYNVKTHPNRFVLVPRVELHRRLHLFINMSRKLIKFITYTIIYRGNSSEHAEIYYYNQFKEKKSFCTPSKYVTFHQSTKLSRPSVPNEDYNRNPLCTLN